MSHVALIVPGLDRLAGAERQAMLIAKGLRRRGWRVSVVALSGSGACAAELAETGIAFCSLAMRKGLADPRGWLRFRRWLRSERPDIVHAHLPHAAWLARWSRLFAPIPALIDTVHSSSTGGPGRRCGYRLSDWLANCVTAVSHAAANSHLRARMVSRDKLVILPNGVDVEAWQPDPTARTTVRRELGLKDEFVWLAAGRLEPVKDYPTLLQALTGVPRPAQLLIAGSGCQRDELVSLCARLGLEERVRFLGFQVDLGRWMQAVDGFVLSSLWEGLPTSLLEAGACGLPAVATDVPGTREAIVDGESGCLAPPGDPPALAKAMNSLVESSPETRQAMGARARQRVSEHFNMESVLNQWEQLYRQVASSAEGLLPVQQSLSEADQL